MVAYTPDVFYVYDNTTGAISAVYTREEDANANKEATESTLEEGDVGSTVYDDYYVDLTSTPLLTLKTTASIPTTGSAPLTISLTSLASGTSGTCYSYAEYTPGSIREDSIAVDDTADLVLTEAGDYRLVLDENLPQEAVDQEITVT